MMLNINYKMVHAHYERIQSRPRRQLDIEALRWTPVISDATIEEEESRTQIEVTSVLCYLTHKASL